VRCRDQRGIPARVRTPSAFAIPESIEALSWKFGMPDVLDQGLIDRPEVQVSYCFGKRSRVRHIVEPPELPMTGGFV
jgi:hypothetical protein